MTTTPTTKTENHSQQTKPAILKAISWFIFAGTATFTAIFLPAHIIALIYNKSIIAIPLLTQFEIILTAILIFSTLFHSLYRLTTILLDLGFPKTSRIINFTNTIFILIVSGFLIYSVFRLF